MPTKKRRKKRSVNVRNLAIVLIGAVVLLAAGIFLISRIFAGREPAKPVVETIDPSEVAETKEPENSDSGKEETPSDESRVSLFLSGDGLLHESV